MTQEWLQNDSELITVESITKDKRSLLDIKSSMSIYETLHVFYQMDVTSAPLYEAPQSNSEPHLICHMKEYIGMVSAADILSYVLAQKDAAAALEDPVHNVIGSTKESLTFFVASENTPLAEVMERFSTVLHRCLVLPATNQHRTSGKLLTQTDVIKFLLERRRVSSLLEEKFRATVEAVKMEDGLLQVNEHALLPEALELIHVHPAVAVVNERGQIVSTLSAADTRSIWRDLETAGPNKSALLTSLSTMTVKDFLLRNSPPGDTTYPRSAVCITRDASIGDAAEYMVRHHIHRVWIIDTIDGVNGVGCGCLSYTDLIRALHALPE